MKNALLVSLASTLTALASVCSGTLIVSDAFTGGTRGNDAGELRDVAWWYESAAGGAPTVAVDAGLGSGNALFVPSNVPIVAPLSQAVTLANVGDWLHLSLDYRQQSVPGSGNNFAPTFGLYHSNGTTVTSDATASSSRNDNGYYVAWRTASTAATWDALGEETGNGAAYILGGVGDRAMLGQSSSGVLALTDLTEHHFDFRLTRTGASAVQLKVWLDGTLYATATDATAPLFTFDEIAFRPAGGAAVIDNIQLYTIPEPSTMFLLSVGGLLLWRRARK